ncbi:transposase [Streptomyces sp. TLI_185]|uniref:transposase n=1 Tax=Streptomyces sp. TLI_185 TaxID=2485151 RepID=UPI000F4F9B71
MRAGIEATPSQNVRACGLRRTRYRGPPKTHIGHVLTALVCNVTRIVDWIAEPPRPPAGTKPLPRPLHRPQLTPARSPTESRRWPRSKRLLAFGFAGDGSPLGEVCWGRVFYGVQSSATTRRSVPGAMRSMAGMTFV